MQGDPITLLVAVNNRGYATGSLYLDDGATFEYQTGQFLHLNFTFELLPAGRGLAVLKSTGRKGKWVSNVRVERVVVLGLLRSLSELGHKGTAVSAASTDQAGETKACAVQVTPWGEQQSRPRRGTDEKWRKDPVPVDQIVVRKPWVLLDRDFTITLR